MSPEEINAIAEAVVVKLKPLLFGNVGVSLADQRKREADLQRAEAMFSRPVRTRKQPGEGRLS